MQYGAQVETSYPKAVEQAATDLKNLVAANGPGSLYAVFSPMMACEEAYLLGTLIRQWDPEALLVLGPVPSAGQNETFSNSLTGKQTFEIQAEKVPNKAGINRVLQLLGGPTGTFDELAAGAKDPRFAKLKGGWIVGGYLSNWITAAGVAALKGYKVVQDILPTALSEKADILLPAAAWAEKDGSWENYAGKLQIFAAGIAPPEGARREGDVYYSLLGREGFYFAADVRQEMGEPFAATALPGDKAAEPAFEFAEL
jgi:NADH-quinone oxidoreductase subunit G